MTDVVWEGNLPCNRVGDRQVADLGGGVRAMVTCLRGDAEWRWEVLLDLRSANILAFSGVQRTVSGVRETAQLARTAAVEVAQAYAAIIAHVTAGRR